MRTLFFIISGIVFLIAHADTFISYPDFSKGTTEIGIESVALTDTATLFDVSFYYNHGYWIKLDPATKLIGRATGKEYPIKSISGMELGVKTYVPFSGYIPAQISFEPLAPADTIVDFIEPEGWEIRGIKLYDTTNGKIKTNVSGTVDSEHVSNLLFFPEENVSVLKNFYVVPVREGKYSYDLYTEKPGEFIVIVGKEINEGRMTIKSFKAEGKPVVIDYDYEELEF